MLIGLLCATVHQADSEKKTKVAFPGFKECIRVNYCSRIAGTGNCRIMADEKTNDSVRTLMVKAGIIVLVNSHLFTIDEADISSQHVSDYTLLFKTKQ